MALALLSITMLASGPFFVNSLTNINKQRTAQAAVQLADTAMEQVRGLKGSSLLSGRSLKATQAQFAGAPAVVKPYLATMQVAGDPGITDVNSTAGADAAISTAAQAVTVEGTTYTENIYVGRCEIYLTKTGECVYPLAQNKAPSDTTKILKFFRVVVLITWPGNTCPAGVCNYITSSLVSSASEPSFDFHRPLPTVLTKLVTFYKDKTSSYQLEARGGQLPNSWSVTPGTLPKGLSMTSNGVVSGTPTVVGSTSVDVTVSDSLKRTDKEPVTFEVLLPPSPTMPATTSSRVGDVVRLPVTAAGGKAPYSFTDKLTVSASSATLPPGLSIDPDTGVITGSPTTPGTYPVTITVTDANNVAGTGTYTHVVSPALTLAPLPGQTIDLGSRLDLTAAGSGGDGKYSYSATGLPPGVTINKGSGAISGKPTASGRFLPTITVTDGSGGTAGQQIVVIVNTDTSLVFTAPTLTSPDQTTVKGTATSLTLRTNGSLLKLSPVLTVTGLPPGLSLNAVTGVISGTPTTAGAYTVTATATAATPPRSSVLTFVWKIT
ncbi:hypothetical protein Asi03nite_51260 [Actinoplanes siamensis]|uniref:Uncharacterized protein n=2 Tax=Actinoplanes siamensis TaxID=1223317 RepID=A0A919NAL7_9ACTN|nr:hypothetical protein Asi03nite_51260 [Actinoplanes siamensis]